MLGILMGQQTHLRVFDFDQERDVHRSGPVVTPRQIATRFLRGKCVPGLELEVQNFAPCPAPNFNFFLEGS